ncbi:hypothetical protein CKALI_08100 [Corynebacterium kalinowskii]|uniref:ABC transporter permease n=1 Tax=Corynebacterium kalinowskii TaxID=2675216 RepID=A0A6B8VYT4_9CORY|nr:hypothetical protein [Corynebacterium kalinowskii]QGU02480.1 hypothetical protein CKALI_08100 [Corynebacterium kalinowskii]
MKVTDVRPFTEHDSRGTGLTVAGFPMVLGGIVGGVLISFMIKGSRKSAGALVLYGILGGLALAGILQFGSQVIAGNFLINALVIGLSLSATTAFIVGLKALIGTPGLPIAAMTTMLLANPISSATRPKEFLPWHWGAIGQFFVPSSSAALLRTESYFPEAPTTILWATLISWTLFGFGLLLLAHLRKHSTRISSSDQ